MQRDVNYMRDLLAEFEASDECVHIVNLGYTRDRTPEIERRYYHVLLLVDAGLMDNCVEGREMDPGIFRMTNAGHEFINLTRENEVWEQAKTVASRFGGHNIQMLCRIAADIARQKTTKMGISMA